MTSFTELLQQGSANAWLFFPTALLLGALHGLEPGHSKTMMAAFIIAVRGTIGQAVLLGLSAALSHSALVWLIAAFGLYYGQQINGEVFEPYFQLVSAVFVGGMALWMFWRTRRDELAAWNHQAHSHYHEHDHAHHHDHPDEHGQSPSQAEAKEPGQLPEEFQDAHEQAHAAEIARRFTGQRVTTGQIVLFGLSGGLIPCPASITVLIICLQLKKFALGFALVIAFSLGLALTMVLTGVIAAWSVRHAEKHFQGFGSIMRRAPYLSAGLLLVVSGFMAFQALYAIYR